MKITATCQRTGAQTTNTYTPAHLALLYPPATREALARGEAVSVNCGPTIGILTLQQAAPVPRAASLSSFSRI